MHFFVFLRYPTICRISRDFEICPAWSDSIGEDLLKVDQQLEKQQHSSPPHPIPDTDGDNVLCLKHHYLYKPIEKYLLHVLMISILKNLSSACKPECLFNKQFINNS